MTTPSDPGRILAVLGPTNTGKTHFALDRMLGHASGMIGFPLRLLARENYDRIAAAKGAENVALITGEEKIIPPRPRWFVCTVESMPLDRRVAFLAIDEIQLCADPERGHIFTDRLLHARGREETVFLGADTIAPLMRRLVPGVEIMTRPRLSRLTYAGARKLNRLPPRSAVVAFSAGEVYAMAEFLRRQKGGAAVVLGALSPRTRNAQVGLYQEGDVDYIVATDAIGMGLNMDVDHVAFAALRKFDGQRPRPLEPSEIAQIAGRAGRHMNDGTFGTTADVSGIDADVVDAVENHAFPALKILSWRASDLRFTSIATLLADLDRSPPSPGLMRTRPADDHLVLSALAADPDVAKLCNHPERVKLLWDVCQIPDFRKVMADAHARLVGQIFHHLTGPGRRVPTDWLAAQISRLDRTDGDMDTLIGRIAHIRIWTYIANRNDWVRDPSHWQGVARTIEDRLSDALHESLTQRFVDRRTAHLVRRLREDSDLIGAVGQSGDVLVEGHFVGRLDGFRFSADTTTEATAAKTVQNAAARALKPEIAARISRLAQDQGQAFVLGDDGLITWNDGVIARLVRGADILRPQAEPLSSDLLEPPQRERIRRRLNEWIDSDLLRPLRPLLAARDTPLSGAGRGLIHQLAEALGGLSRVSAAPQIRALTLDDRRHLARLGVRIGFETIFLPALLKPAPQRLRAHLWQVWTGTASNRHLPLGRAVLMPADTENQPSSLLHAVGYLPMGRYAVRADMAERFLAQLRALNRSRPDGFPVTPELCAILGISRKSTEDILAALGYGPATAGEDSCWRKAETTDRLKTERGTARPGKRKRPSPTDTPFHVLKSLKLG